MTARVSLAARLDLTAARPLAGQLRHAAGQAVEVDASAVQMLGGLCLQVLLAATQRWRRDGIGLRVVAPSPGFTAALQQFGIGAGSLEAVPHSGGVRG